MTNFILENLEAIIAIIIGLIIFGMGYFKGVQSEPTEVEYYLIAQDTIVEMCHQNYIRYTINKDGQYHIYTIDEDIEDGSTENDTEEEGT
jgi:hypothetical protein